MTSIVRSPDQTGADHFHTSDLRFSVMLKASLYNDDFPEGLSLCILNISEGGIMAVIPYGVRVYSEVVIGLRNLPPVSGRVAWCKRDRVGITFDEKIDLDVFFGRRVSQQATGFLHKLNAGRSEINAEPFIRTLNS